jgi:hypothetical protein
MRKKWKERLQFKKKHSDSELKSFCKHLWSQFFLKKCDEQLKMLIFCVDYQLFEWIEKALNIFRDDLVMNCFIKNIFHN